jgi:putative DNA primase/helicase
MSKQQEFINLFPNTVFTAIPEGGDVNSGEVIHSSVVDFELNKKGYGLFFSVNGFSEETRRQDYLTNLNAVFCDIDFPKTKKDKTDVESFKNDVIKELSTFDLSLIPTAIVKTKNGLHVYWVLDQPIKLMDIPKEDDRTKLLQRWRTVIERVIARFNADPQAKDVTRVLRIPETLHLKDPTDPYLCSLFFFQPDNNYTLEQLEKGFLTPLPPDAWAVANSDQELSKEVKEKISFNYPKLSRPSYKQLMDLSKPLPEGTRNQTLLILAAACKEEGWPQEKTLEYFTEFHGLGIREIQRTINSAYYHNYDFGFNNEVIKPLVTPEERGRLSEITSQILSKQSKDYLTKERSKTKEQFYIFETIIAMKYPHLKYKLNSNAFYDYNPERGLYVRYEEEAINSLVLSEMLAEGLKEYRKLSCVKDKIACFKSLPGKVFSHKQENPDKNIINVKNGLFDISTFTLRSHTPDYISTTQIPIEYSSDAKCPQWQQFLHEVTNGDKEQIRLLRQICGYCLTSDVEFHKAFILYGTGRNGKGTFSKVLSKIVGEENTSNIDLNTLNKQFGLTGIIGKKLNIIDEISGNYFESDVIKKIISGQRMSADIKYQKLPTEFDPIAKVVFSVNELPKINDTTPGLYERFILIPFTRHFTNPDLHLIGKLTSELPGILNDSIEALKDLRECGQFNETKKNIELLNEFKSENSPILEFLRSKYTPALDDEERVKYRQDGMEMYRAYGEYCRLYGYKQKNYANFMKELMHTFATDFKSLAKAFDRDDGRMFVVGLKPLATLKEGYKVAYA